MAEGESDIINDKKIISPFTFFIQEIRKDNAFRKMTDDKKVKRVMLGSMWQCCIVLFGLLVLYYLVIANIGITIATLEPLRILSAIIPVLVIWAWGSFAKKVLVKNKNKFFQQENIYEDYVQASEHIT